MTTVSLSEAQAHLTDLIARLAPGEEVLITRDDKPIARLVPISTEKPQRVSGRGRGKLTIVSDDDEHLQDWNEYLP